MAGSNVDRSNGRTAPTGPSIASHECPVEWRDAVDFTGSGDVPDATLVIHSVAQALDAAVNLMDSDDKRKRTQAYGIVWSAKMLMENLSSRI